MNRRIRTGMGTGLLAAAALLASVRQAWAPREPLTVADWADRYRVLSSAATPTPGPWRTDREPWQRGIMNALHEGAATIVVMKGAQLGLTESLVLNAIGYHIMHDPGPMLLVEPSESMARRLSKNRLSYMLTATPGLAARVPAARSRTSANALLHKSFPGGYLVLSGANSPTALASDPMRLVFFDEVDKYPPHLGDEGDPVSLGMKRTATFWSRRHVLISTPTRVGASKIHAWFLLSDQRRFMVPCPACGHRDWFTWNDPKHFWIEFEARDPATARLVCPQCRARLEDHERTSMIATAEREFRAGRAPDPWQPQAPFRGVIGFHVWAAHKATTTLAQIVGDFLRARELGLDELREWWNGTLGEPWEEPGEAIQTSVLLARRGAYRAELPDGVLYVTAGVDTQDDRLEAWIWGWGLGKEAWLIDVRTLPGDPREPEVWALLDELRARQWTHARGFRPRIARVAIDSAGHRTDHVYAYVARTQHHGVRATIGRDGPRAIWTPGHQPRPGAGRRSCPLYVVGVDNAKAEVAAMLKLVTPGAGFVHLPLMLPGEVPLDEAYLDQLTAERWTRKTDRRKRTRWVWELKKAGLRNEGLDCTVLALWALSDLRPDMKAAAERVAQAPTTHPPQLAPAPPAGVLAAAIPVAVAVPASTAPRPPGRRFARSTWMTR